MIPNHVQKNHVFQQEVEAKDSNNGSELNPTKVISHLDNTNNNQMSSNTQVTRQGFLVSFLVDARGGALNGCRHSGVKVTIPPKTAPQPMRITCRYVKKDALLYPPPLNEGEGLACRILQVGPKGSKFLGPVVIELPHIASLREGEREVIVLRCESSAKGKWTEHHQEQDIDDKFLRNVSDDCLSSASSSTNSSTSSPAPIEPLLPGSSRSGLSPTSCHQNSSTGSPQPSPHRHPPERPRQLVRILTKDFPQYFAIVTRIRQDIQRIGPEGGLLKSTQLPKAQVHIRPKSLLKPVDVGISVVQVEDACAEEIVEQGGSVSPILTIEPRRRKFHRAFTISMPLPIRAKEVLLNQVGDGQHPPQRGQCSSTGTKGPIGSLSKSFVLPPDPVKEVLTPARKPNKKNQSKSNNETGCDEDSSKIEMSLRLICSMSGNYSKACWEDVTESTPMSLKLDGGGSNLVVKAEVENHRKQGQTEKNVPVQNQKDDDDDSVQFTSIISASFLLVHCPNWMRCDLPSLVDQMYKNASRVPYFGRFHIYARRYPIHHNVFGSNNHCDESPPFGTPITSAITPSSEKSVDATHHISAHIRVLCITELDQAINPHELQEDFVEICRSNFVELFEKAEIDIKFSGNVIQGCWEALSSQGSTLTDVNECHGACQEFDHGVEKHQIVFHPFNENRQGFLIRRLNDKNPISKGAITFFNAHDDKVLYQEKIDLSKFI